MRILIVEDDRKMARILTAGLRAEGHATDLAETGEAAIALLARAPYEAVILDVMLPGRDGLEVCRTLRAAGNGVGVLMLTARDAVPDRVTGLDAGADDYLVKPFAFPELAARARVLLRRDSAQRDAVLVVGPVRLDTARHEAWRGDRKIDLTAKEFTLLRYFMANPGQVISQERLLEHVWDENADPFTNTVRVTVGTLRRKLTIDDEEPLLETIVGAGYRLLGADP